MLAMPRADAKPLSGTTTSMDMANYTVEENTHRLRRTFPESNVPDSCGRSFQVASGYPNVIRHYFRVLFAKYGLPKQLLSDNGPLVSTTGHSSP